MKSFQGVSLFHSVKDHINETFLLSNLGQFYRLKLLCQMYLADYGEPYKPEKEKSTVLEAIDFYQQALACATGFKGTEFPLFESISKELAGTYLTYAVRLQDNMGKLLECGDFQKLTSEVHEFLSRASAGYEYIRNSSKCSTSIVVLADQLVVEIMFRYGKLAQQSMQYHAAHTFSARKQRDCKRQAIEHFNDCFKYVLGKISANTKKTAQKQRQKVISFVECVTAIRAVFEIDMCVGALDIIRDAYTQGALIPAPFFL
ncbi:unnamed protein product [Gongylonema pulchrum]|uniref:BRO1 domain-containing protein n=1 Tax=Gongylonema pulchrum TaxID=637853 RepID=A0A183D080_9BILA|nr:unnamed protein product [Gongylonema pulchrum]